MIIRYIKIGAERMSDMDLKTRAELLPCGKCEDMLDCDDCYHQKEAQDIYQQIRADALSIDMDKPMHFTTEQKAWIKNYIIINAKRQRADAIDEFANALINDGKVSAMRVLKIKEQLKSQN